MRGQKLVATRMLPVTATVLTMAQDWQHRANRINKRRSSIKEHHMRSIEFLREAAPIANPYTGADAARFAALTPTDQQALTKDGQQPDLSDQFILNRLPNKGKTAAGGTLPAGAPIKPLTVTDGSGNPVQDGSRNPVQAGAGQPVNPPPTSAQAQLAANIAAVRRAEAELGAGAQASTTSAEQSAAAATTSPVTPPTALNPGPIAAAPNSAAADAERDGAPVAPAAPAAAPNSAAADAERDGAPVAPAATAPAPASNPTDARLQAGTQTAPTGAAAPKAGSDPKIKALQDELIAAGAKIKSDGIMGPATQAAMKQFFPTAAAGQASLPAGKPPRYKTPQEYDREIARFSKTSDPKLPPNARYIATLQAEKAALAGKGAAATPAKPLPGKTPFPGAGTISDTPAAESRNAPGTFAESVDLMRRLSNMLKE